MALKFRRGTTAQKSGSLAFGEPYVNTTLGTLQIGLDNGDVTLSAIGTGSNLSVSGISGSSLDVTGNAKIDGNVTILGTITAKEIHTSIVTSSVLFESGSTNFGDSADDIHTFTGSVYMAHALQSGYFRASNITGSQNHLAYFTDGHSINGASSIQITNSGSTIGMGTTGFDVDGPERLVVDNGDSYNIATFQTSQNDTYAEVNIKNFGSGSSSSTDLVLWNDISTEGSDYVDLGINSSNYSAGIIGYENDAYLTTTAADLYIGPYGSGSHAHLHLYGGGAWDTPAITIDNTNEIHISSSILPDSNNVFDLGSSTNYFKDLYVSTGSIKFVDNTGVVGVFGLNTLNALLASTGSSDSKFETLATYTSSVDNRLSLLSTYTGSNDTTNTTQNGRLSNLETKSASVDISVSNLNTYTGSLNNAIQLTGSTVSFLGNIVVYGTQSVINSENVQISDNILYLSPTASIDNDLGIVGHYNDGTYRHAGIFMDASDGHSWKVFNGLTTETNATIDTAGNGFALADFKAGVITGTSIIGSIAATNGVISGSTQVLGILSSLNTYTGSNDTTNTTQNSRLDQLSTASGSAITRLTGLEVETANLETFSASTLTRLSTLEGKDISVTLTGDVTGTGTITDLGNVSFATTIAANSVALGTDTTGDYVASLVAGTNITLSNNSGEGATPTIGLTNNAITIAGQSTALGSSVTADTIRTAIGTVVTGSSQIAHDSTTGYSANRHIDHTAVSISAGSGLTGGGDISATRTLSIATGGVTNGMLANSTISGISLGSNLATLTIGTGLSGTSYNGSGAVTIANTGVTSNVAGTGVSVSGATGAVTISIGQSVATNATPTFGNLTINGTITATGDITAYYTSDRRHKNNIQNITNALDKVKKLNGVTWEWKDDVNEVTKSTPTTGLIAQEVQEVLPEVVVERENGYLGLDYSKMMGLLVEAIKEQQIKIDNLTVEVERLKKQKGL